MILIILSAGIGNKRSLKSLRVPLSHAFNKFTSTQNAVEMEINDSNVLTNVFQLTS